MNALSRGLRNTAFAATLAALPALAQDTAAQQAEIGRAMEEVRRLSIDVQEKAETRALDLAGLKANLALMKPADYGLQLKRFGGGDGAYDAGTRALDERKYDEAIQRFNAVIDAKGTRADGALYWKAYALNRIGRREEALAAVAALRRDYPQSHWLNDAQALEAEVKQRSGQAVSPSDETNEDLKLMAINSLMNADPDRAIPLLENLLKGSSAPRVKDRAMFVLTQSRSPRAHQVLSDYAKGAGNPDLQIRAIRYIGMSGTAEAQQQLATIYNSSADTSVKREILRGLMVSRGKDQIFNLAKTEKDPELRLEAIRQLGVMKANDELVQLYGSENSEDNKVQIVRSLFVGGATDKLLDIVKTEKDGRVRTEAIRSMAMTKSTSVETLAQLYSADSNPKTRRELINGLHSRGDAKAMVDLAKKESDPAMKRYIVERLSNMHSKEATDYMMELLK
jgi:HEAT repeat protein